MTKTKDFTLKKQAFVATYETEEELHEYFNIYSGNEKFLMYLGAALCWNMIAHWQEEGLNE